MSALRRALAAGSLTALAIDLWMLAGPHWSLTRDTAPLGAFYDVQGRAFLDGHLAVPPSAVGFEGFDVGGATYIYYGPVLALLRLPVLLVTHRLDGRLTQLSMLLALGVLLVAAGDLYERVRRLVRPDAAVARGRARARLPRGAGARGRERRPLPGGHARGLRGDRAVGGGAGARRRRRHRRRAGAADRRARPVGRPAGHCWRSTRASPSASGRSSPSAR